MVRVDIRRFRKRGGSGLCLLLAATAAATWATQAGTGAFAVAGGRRPLTPGRDIAVATASGTATAEAPPATAQPDTATKLWSLVVKVTDHYVWRDEDTFVGLVADAGEWTVDISAIRAAFAEANRVGTAEVFSAPLYVVKAYVRELRNYGLVSEAQEASADADDGKWSERDWKELSPESKDASSEERAVRETTMSGTALSIYLTRSDAPVWDGSKRSRSKFAAYIEMATDAAKRFAPDEAVLGAAYDKLLRTDAPVAVLTGLTVAQAELAGSQLRRSGFEVSSEVEKAST